MLAGMMKDDIIVGHVPCEKSCIVWYFIEHDEIVSLLSGTPSYSFQTLQLTDEATCHEFKLYMLNRE